MRVFFWPLEYSWMRAYDFNLSFGKPTACRSTLEFWTVMHMKLLPVIDLILSHIRFNFTDNYYDTQD